MCSKKNRDINVISKTLIARSNDTTICKNSSAQLFTSGGMIYNWSPAGTLNNSSIFNPVATPSANTIYYVTVTDSKTCKNTDSIEVNIRPDPIFTINNSANVCENNSIRLNAGGGDL